MTTRQNRIYQLLNLPFSSLVIKYDHYFSGELISNVLIEHEETDEVTDVFTFEGYYVALLTKTVVISNYRTNKTFSLEEDKRFLRFCVPLSSGKFLFLSSGKFLFLTYEPPSIYIIDFNTENIQLQELDIDSDISYVKMMENKIVLSTYDEIFIIDSETLLVENMVQTGTINNGLVIYKNQIISIDIGDGSMIVNFWNSSNLEFINSININDTLEDQSVSVIKCIKNKLILGYSSGRIVIMDLEGKNSIIDIERDEQLSVRDILIRKNNFVVRFEDCIQIFDLEGDLIDEILLENQLYIFSLPNDQMLIMNEENIKLYDFDTYELQHITNLFLVDNYKAAISSTGKLIVLLHNGELLIYK